MDYQIGKIARVVVARGFDGEDVYGEIESLAARENINNAAVILLGGLRSGKVVVGPKEAGRLYSRAFELNSRRKYLSALRRVRPEADQ